MSKERWTNTNIVLKDNNLYIVKTFYAGHLEATREVVMERISLADLGNEEHLSILNKNIRIDVMNKLKDEGFFEFKEAQE